VHGLSLWSWPHSGYRELRNMHLQGLTCCLPARTPWWSATLWDGTLPYGTWLPATLARVACPEDRQLPLVSWQQIILRTNLAKALRILRKGRRFFRVHTWHVKNLKCTQCKSQTWFIQSRIRNSVVDPILDPDLGLLSMVNFPFQKAFVHSKVCFLTYLLPVYFR
jgi:hypothetical protein